MTRRLAAGFLILACAIPGADRARATVVITRADASLSAETAANASSPAWTTLGNIILAEGSRSDFARGNNVTLILKAPAGFQFDTAVTPSVTYTAGRNIASASAVMTDSATITITLTVTGTLLTDTLNIGSTTGIRVQPTATAPLASGNITVATNSTASVSGITKGTTSLGTLTEAGGMVTQLAFTTQPGGARAGAVFGTPPVLKSLDQYGNLSTNGLPATSFISLTLSSGTGPLQGTTSTNLGMGGARGSITFSNLRIDVAGADKQLTATSTNGLGSALSGVFAVNPGPATKLVIGTQPSATATVGVPLAQQPVIYVLDAYNNLCSTNSTVSAIRTAGAGTLLGTTNLAAVGGVVTYTNLAHPYATNITLRFTSTGLTAATSGVVAVSPNTYSKLVVLAPGQTSAPGTASGVGGTPTALTVGSPSTVRVLAADAYGNPISSVTNLIRMTSSDGSAVLPADAALINGTNSYTVTLKAAGTQTVTASDVTDGTTTGTSSALTVNRGPFVKLQLLVPGETAAPGTSTGKTGLPSVQVSNVAFTVTVNAVDAYWNLVTSASGSSYTIRVTSSDPNATLPADANLSNGTRTFAVALKTAGSWTITATDLDDGTKTPSTSPPISLYGITAVARMRPMVAVHDSELTRALGSMAATNATPAGPGTTGFEWWPTNWHYFVMPESVKEVLRSDGTVYEVIGDADISAGRLLAANGQPRCPIMISLASEAIGDDQIAPLTNYVAAGGTLLVGSSAFTRRPDGTSRGDFALAGPMGLHMANASLLNWAQNTHLSKIQEHSLVAHLPGGVLTWRLPAAADEISWGISPSHALGGPHWVWQVQPSDAAVIAQGTASPYLTLKPYGKGRFIYCAAMQPLIGHGGNAPGMYAYGIFRKAIELAFASAQLPVPKLSPWPYAYDAALNVRHDLENYQPLISTIESSAAYEAANGVKGDYYFCTGTLRVEITNAAAVIASLGRAVSNYGATIGSHNGGLQNPHNESLGLSDYDYWHWGPDEALDVTPAGYASGKAYALTSISNSFRDIAGWVPGLTNSIRSWVGCYFNSIREDSYDILEQLKVKTAGEQKLGPFPHWTVSTRTAGKRYAFASLPVSDWYVGTQVAQAMETGHTVESVRAAVDFYYDLGGLINLYSHSLSDGTGYSGGLVQEYIRYSMAKPRVWSTNAAGVYGWWLARSNVQVTASYTTDGNQVIATLAVSGATDPRTAVEWMIPQGGVAGLEVLTNGVLATGNSYRTNGLVIKVLTGTSVNTVELRYSPLPVAQDDLYYAVAGATLSVPAAGVLSNDVPGLGGSLTAELLSGPVHGVLDLNTNGGFTYTPGTNYSGMDTFTYRVKEGLGAGNVATVALVVTVPGQVWFADDFARATNPAPLWPWVAQAGTWTLTGGQMQSGPSPAQSYGYAWLSNTWTDCKVQARVQFPAGAFGGGLGGRLNLVTGARYAAWIYPESSPGGAGVLRLIKFQNWSSFSTMGQVSLPSVGTDWHALRMVFQGATIMVYYDESLLLMATDTGTQPYLSGGISLEMWTGSTPYVMAVDDVLVGPSGTDQTITFEPLDNKSYGDPPFTVSATASSGLPVIFSVLSGPATIAGDTVTLAGAGTVTIRASQPGDGTYNSAPPVDRSFRVAPASDGLVFAETFARPLNPGSLSPWVAQQGLWGVTGDMLQGSSMGGGYSYAYLDGSWTNYSAEGQVQLSSASGWGGGIGGRLNPVTGAHYGAWIYPDGSPGGANVLKLVKFWDWVSWGGTPMTQVTLPAVGTGWHTLRLEFLTNQITVYFDGTQVASVTDNNFDGRPPYLSGGITADMYTSPDTPYAMALDNVLVKLLRPALTVTANDASRAYGATNPAFSGTITGLNEGDNITASYSTTATTNSPIGAYSIVPTLNDPDQKVMNYNLTVSNRTLSVTAAALSVVAESTNRPYGTSNPAFTGTLTGIQNGDNITATYATSATEASPVGDYEIIPALEDPAGKLVNYTVSSTNGTLTITPAPLTVTADTRSKVYGEADPVLTWQITSGSLYQGGNLLGGDWVSGSLARVAGENVGVYAIEQGTLKAGTNYDLTYVSADLTITPASAILDLVSSPNPSSRGANVTLTATVSPIAPAASTPTGQVQFYANDAALGGPVVLADGVASLDTAGLPTGTNTVLAAYLGDGNYSASSNTLAQVISPETGTPIALGIQTSGAGSVTVTFAGTPGAQYLVQACASPDTPTWVSVSTNVAGADGRWTFTEPISGLPQRYYRAATP